MKRTTDKTRFATLSGAGKAMRTTILSVVAAALLGLGLAACGGDDDEPFLIGLSVFDSLSHFKEMRRAAKFAAADINAAGGNVAFEEVDIDRALFFEGKQPADSLRELVDKGVKGLVGPTTSVTSVASFRFVTDNGLVTISPSVNSDSISDLNSDESGQRYFFRTLPHNDYQAEILAKRALGKVLILHRDDEYGRDIKEHVESYLVKKFKRPAPLSVPITIENRPGVMITDAMARQVADVSVGRLDAIVGAQELLDRLRLRGRFHDHKLHADASPCFPSSEPMRTVSEEPARIFALRSSARRSISRATSSGARLSVSILIAHRA